jgi:hypothetical protein
VPPARGILRGLFKDWNEIQQFVAEERASWDGDPSLETQESSGE